VDSLRSPTACQSLLTAPARGGCIHVWTFWLCPFVDNRLGNPDKTRHANNAIQGLPLEHPDHCCRPVCVCVSLMTNSRDIQQPRLQAGRVEGAHPEPSRRPGSKGHVRSVGAS